MRAAGRALLLALALAAIGPSAAAGPTPRVARVIDGDTIELQGGARVRLVQIDAPETHFGSECYGRAAAGVAARLLPVGTPVSLASEPATDRIDRYGRLLRYVTRVRDGVNVNLRLVAVGAAAPYFYGGRHGRYAALLDRLARRARAAGLGLWAACPGTRYDPERQIRTGP
jgi:endonuclease YncB( thermonuclease family)